MQPILGPPRRMPRPKDPPVKHQPNHKPTQPANHAGKPHRRRLHIPHQIRRGPDEDINRHADPNRPGEIHQRRQTGEEEGELEDEEDEFFGDEGEGGGFGEVGVAAAEEGAEAGGGLGVETSAVVGFAPEEEDEDGGGAVEGGKDLEGAAPADAVGDVAG